MEVRPGDTIRSEVFVKYFKPQEQQATQVSAFALTLPALTSTATLGDPGAMMTQSGTGVFPIPLAGGTVEEIPKAYLNYVLYDRDMNMLDAGYQRVSSVAEIPQSSPELHQHERLSEELIIEDFGYLQVYVSNSSQEESEVFFDDFSVTQTSSQAVRAHDYYPFGLPMKDLSIEDEEYRYGFQGEFAEEDSETGWNSFELRMYDPTIGRWTTIDPDRQFASPYIYAGNNVVNLIDKDGALATFGGGIDPNSVFFVQVEARGAVFLLTGSVAFGVMVDTHGNYSVYRTFSIGGGVGLGGTGGVAVGVLTSNTIYETTGLGINLGAWADASVGIGLHGAAEANFLLEGLPNNPIDAMTSPISMITDVDFGGTVAIPALGLGIGLGVYLDHSWTDLLYTGNLEDVLDNFYNLYELEFGEELEIDRDVLV